MGQWRAVEEVGDVGDNSKKGAGLQTLVLGQRNHHIILIPQVKGIGVRWGERCRDVGRARHVPFTVFLQILILWT